VDNWPATRVVPPILHAAVWPIGARTLFLQEDLPMSTLALALIPYLGAGEDGAAASVQLPPPNVAASPQSDRAI
jgi:hypothetical protein